MRLAIGEVIRWDLYPHPADDSEIKPRWFIYLGHSPSLITPVFHYLVTTTTQLSKFEPGGERANHDFRRFDVRQFPMFAKDCILDFDGYLHRVTEDLLVKCSRLIESKGQLDQDTQRNIYKRFLQSGNVSRKIMLDIHDSFNLAGITNLKKP